MQHWSVQNQVEGVALKRDAVRARDKKGEVERKTSSLQFSKVGGMK